MAWDEKTQAWILTIAAGVVGWLVKDFFFGVLAKRDESARSEWKEMLKGLWCPLYYWSGIVTYCSGKEGWNGHGVGELEKLLAASAHFIPRSHYRTLICLVEHSTGLESKQPSMSDVKAMREYVYGQIEALNYLLYRHPTGYDPAGATDLLSGPKTVFRFLSVLVLHLFVWACLVAALLAVYAAYSRHLFWPSVVLGVIFLVAIALDWWRRLTLHRELQRRLRVQPSRSPR